MRAVEVGGGRNLPIETGWDAIRALAIIFSQAFRRRHLPYLADSVPYPEEMG
jgi:hypothetical protein